MNRDSLYLGDLPPIHGGYIGGYLFIPPTPNLTPGEIITRALDTLATSATFNTIKVGPYGQRKNLASADATALAELMRTGQGFVAFTLPPPLPNGIMEQGIVTFDSHPSGYYLVNTSFDPIPLRSFDATDEDRATVQDVYERWVRCCERVGADYAYFGSLGVENLPEYAEQELSQVLRQDVKSLLSGYQSYWLLYFRAPNLAAAAKQLPLKEPEITRQELHSGAIVIRREEFPVA